MTLAELNDEEMDMIHRGIDYVCYIANYEVAPSPAYLMFQRPLPELRLQVTARGACHMVGEFMAGFAEEMVKEALLSGCLYSVQFVGVTLRGVPYVALVIWIPMVPECIRCVLRVEKFAALFSTVQVAISAETEGAMVRSVLEDFLPSIQAPLKNLVSVTCTFTPTSFSMYEVTHVEGTHLSLRALVPSIFRGSISTGGHRRGWSAYSNSWTSSATCVLATRICRMPSARLGSIFRGCRTGMPGPIIRSSEPPCD